MTGAGLVGGSAAVGVTGVTGATGPPGGSTSTAFVITISERSLLRIVPKHDDAKHSEEDHELGYCETCGRVVDESGVFRRNVGEGFDPNDE